jgi:hypothetical protein
LTIVEERAQQVRQFLVYEPVQECIRDAIQLTEPDDDGLVVLVTAEAIEMRLPTVEWTTGYAGPVPASRFWKRVARRDIDPKWLKPLLEQARQARRDQYQVCHYCGQATPRDAALFLQ